MTDLQLFIKGVSKNKNSNTHKIDIKSTDTVRSLILILTNLFKINERQFYLTFGSHILCSDTTLEEYGIVTESTIYLNFKLLSCKTVDKCR